jgi:hypothetical protein
MYTKFFVELLYGNVDSYFPFRIHKCIVVLITTHPGFNRWKEDAVGLHILDMQNTILSLKQVLVVLSRF